MHSVTWSTASHPVIGTLLSTAYAVSLMIAASSAVQIISQPQNIRVLNGDRVQLACTIDSNELNNVIIWTHNNMILSQGSTVFRPSGMTVKVDKQRSSVTYSIVIDSVSPATEGVYECQLPAYGMTQVNRVTVDVAPTITLFFPDSPHHEVYSGDILQLECRANGTPQPNITWTRQGDDEELLIHSNRGVSSFVVEDVVPRDTGTYICTADNGVGVASRQLRVIVKSAPVVTVVNNVIHVGFKGELLIDCYAECNPQASFRWRLNGNSLDINSRGGEIVVNNRRLSDNRHVSTLRIYRVQLNDVGVYTCMAVNELGMASTDIVVTGTPDELKIVSKEESRYSDQYTLQWTVRSLSPVLNTQVSLELESSGSVNDSLSKLLTFVALKNDDDDDDDSTGDDDDVLDTSQQRFYYIISGLQSDTLYIVSMRMSNVFGFGNWTQPFYFETAAAGRPAPYVSHSAARSSHSRHNAGPSSVLRSATHSMMATVVLFIVRSLLML